jgi:two-component system sensor kinase FixL
MNTSVSQLGLAAAAGSLNASNNAELALSPELTIIACNAAYSSLQGVSGDTLTGKSIRQAFLQNAALELLIDSLDNVVRLRRPHRVTAQAPTAARGRSPADRPLPTLSMINIPVLDTSGAVQWILHCLDPTSNAGEPSAMAAALEAAEARLRSVLQTVPDAMIIIDDRGRIESFSSTAQQLFGYSLAEVVGHNVSRLMPSPDREQHDTYIRRYISTGERRIIGIGRVVVGQRKDGTTFPMHLTVGELRSAERHYFTGFIHDLTTQQITEARLRELQLEVTHMSRYTALGEMASTLAHEINQPLTAISNYLRGSQRLLERIETESTPVLREALGKAANEALRAGHIIRRLREFVTRGESDRRIESLIKLVEDACTLGGPASCWRTVSRFSRSWST